MGTDGTLMNIFNKLPEDKALWEGKYKIPWDEPEFSRRMLKEHLSQEHDLASRKQSMIEKQVSWIHEVVNESKAGRLLDIGCGPGLYMEHLIKRGYECHGIDFSPASIAYAQSRMGDKAKLAEADVRTADFGEGFDTAMMLFGELNVFSPAECRNLLKKAYNALVPGGRILIEVHRLEAFTRMGETPNGWYKSGTGLSGLFSDEPHLCLMENHWYEKEQTALQMFYIIDAKSGRVQIYRSTNRAWTEQEYERLLKEAGFEKITLYRDWPVHSEDLRLYGGVKGQKKIIPGE